MTSSTQLPSPSNDYAAPAESRLTLAFWNAALTDVGRRLREAEAIRADFEALIATGTDQALAVISANVAPQLVQVGNTIAALQAAVQAAEDQIAALTGGGSGSISPLLVVQDATHRFITDATLSDLQARVTTAQLNAATAALKDWLVNDAGSALDQFNELASALGNDPNFAATVLTGLAKKVDFESLGDGSIAAAATTDLGSVASLRVAITAGAASISDFGPGQNKMRRVRLAVDVTLVAGARLILPGGANIAGKAGDVFFASSDGSLPANWRVWGYGRADGTPLAPHPGSVRSDVAQTLAGAAKAQARANIGAAGLAIQAAGGDESGISTPQDARLFVDFVAVGANLSVICSAVIDTTNGNAGIFTYLEPKLLDMTGGGALVTAAPGAVLTLGSATNGYQNPLVTPLVASGLTIGRTYRVQLFFRTSVAPTVAQILPRVQQIGGLNYV